jgi:hypothetical protein
MSPVARAGLASYLCRLCTLCVHLSALGGDIHPTTIGFKTALVLRFRPMVDISELRFTFLRSNNNNYKTAG